MNIKWTVRALLVLLSVMLAAVQIATGWTQAASADASAEASSEFSGRVQIAGSPVAGSTVTLYAAGEGKPIQLAQGKSGEDGTFKFDVGADQLKGAADKVLYLVARRGTPKAVADKGPNDVIALLAVLGSSLPK